MVELTVLSVAGDTLCKLTVEPAWTGREVKREVGSIVGVCPCKQELVRGAALVDDARALVEDLCGQSSAVVVLVRRSKLPEGDLDELATKGFCAFCLKGEGFDCRALQGVGFGIMELLNAGIPSEALRQEGFGARELKRAGVQLGVLRVAGYPVQELRDAYCAWELLWEGYHPRELLEGGFLIRDLRMCASTLRAYGFHCWELRDAGFSPRQLKSVGFSCEDIREGVHRLRGKHHASLCNAAGLSGWRAEHDDVGASDDISYCVVQSKRSIRLQRR